ncbi:hypothetical protein [Methanoculleus chikugoensis]|uniref:MBL fold metallo-hydrolase n=1 Tax=Methanoculleus chikugoensis TaxID=118126 RepID=UPI001FB2C50E|nr:MBL fold metallo-hydrolase [Methanoculleus chikugoensis]
MPGRSSGSAPLSGRGETFSFGPLELEILETPGHTVESISLLLRDRSVSDDPPLMVFTGDALFAGDVGRTDLAGEDKRREASELLYESLHQKILPLPPDGTIVCPPPTARFRLRREDQRPGVHDHRV